MDDNSRRELVVDTIKEVSGLNGSVPPDKDLYSELGVESVHAISILLALEEKCAVAIDDTKFVQARTVDGLVTLLAEATG